MSSIQIIAIWLVHDSNSHHMTAGQCITHKVPIMYYLLPSTGPLFKQHAQQLHFCGNSLFIFWAGWKWAPLRRLTSPNVVLRRFCTTFDVETTNFVVCVISSPHGDTWMMKLGWWIIPFLVQCGNYSQKIPVNYYKSWKYRLITCCSFWNSPQHLFCLMVLHQQHFLL